MKGTSILSFTMGIGIGLVIGSLLIWQLVVLPLQNDFEGLLSDHKDLLDKYEILLNQHSDMIEGIQDFTSKVSTLIDRYKGQSDMSQFTNDLVEILLNFFETIV